MADEALTTEEWHRRELLRLDVLLRKKQAWWEHPRNFAILLGVLAALFSALGYKIGSAPPPPIIVHIDQPIGR